MERRSRSTGGCAARRTTRRVCALVVVSAVAVLWPCAWLAGQQPGQGEAVADVRIVGNSTVELAKIVPYIKTRAGRPYDSQVVLEDIRRLNRSRMFASVSTENRRDDSGGLVVIFRVVERPVLQYVKYIGLRNALEKNMEEETNLKVGEPVDPYAVTEGKRKIEEWYKAKGFNLVQVTIIEGTKATDRGAQYLIHEGPQQQISKIEFVGNTIVTGSRLRTQIQTGSVWFGYFWGYLDRAKLEEDERILERYYKNLGFLTARIRADLDFDETQTYCTLRFVVDEGPRCKIDNVRFIGVNKFRVEDLESMLELKPGQFFDGTMLARDKAIVEQIYGSYGYAFANVKTEPQVLEDASRMDLVYVIEEGKRYRVGDIRPQIEGEKPHTNLRTVLNRIELQPGDILDVRKLRRSEVRLQRSQLFAVDPARGIRPHIVVQPADEMDGEMIASKKGASSSGTSTGSASAGSTSTGSTGRSLASPGRSSSAGGGFRGQSPDDRRPQDVWVPLTVVGHFNPNAPPAPAPAVDERELPSLDALPDGRLPPPLKVEPKPLALSPPAAGPAHAPTLPASAAPRFRPWGTVPLPPR